ncbi:Inositolphosphorylceramide synthase subunit Kei1-domain-containing protein [Tuber borchii]|uniref:Inositolphosphorylceramide synthase subunit Kei1-domain-containing protein n=1 Tax=Tuber borchii TaxID=42251 RepID=A0A2T6ZV43_TUBBO|nr:Inositolphosphorylceramide synthase subunit Kei1-domain-containing protein [Tuber borchii]
MPRPTHFLGILDLQHGAEVILVCTLFNKISGLYGIMAMLIGAEISTLQLSMYFYSLLMFGALIYILPKIHQRNPLAAISFAYLYLADSLVNAFYTLLFGISWFLVLASKHNSAMRPVEPVGEVMDNTASLTPSGLNASEVDVVTYPSTSGQDAVVIGSGEGASFLASGVLQPEGSTSILIISVIWLIRVYFVIIVMAFAREVVRGSATPGEAPFTGRNYGEGWQGTLGRALVSCNRRYWEGKSGWIPFGSKFRRSVEPEDGRRRRDSSEGRSLPV